ncbi:hypothetical protein [Microbacterium lushaniae]|nr:hypothetical protein [Microbacterium lushaniae]
MSDDDVTLSSSTPRVPRPRLSAPGAPRERSPASAALVLRT